MHGHLFDKKFFALGVNLAWLDGQYDHDLGKNEVMGCDFRSLDEQQRKDHLDAYFKDISLMNARVVRFWLFERFEGLKFDQEGKVTGIDDGMMNNIADVFHAARKHDLYLYLCLMDTWGVSAQHQEHLPRLNDMMLKEHIRKSFIDNALKPFIADTRTDNKRIFAIDVMNEPEGMYVSLWRADIEWQDIMTFIKECTIAIHENSRFKVSCGFQHYQTLMDNTDTLNDLDFYDYHEYNDDGTLIPCQTLGLTKPCIIGACGQKNEKYDDKIQSKAVEGFLKNAWKNQYAGCLVWNYNYKGYDVNDTDNRFSLIKSKGEWRDACNALVRFGKKYRRHMITSDFV
jgi:hypothetical protein